MNVYEAYKQVNDFDNTLADTHPHAFAELAYLSSCKGTDKLPDEMIDQMRQISLDQYEMLLEMSDDNSIRMESVLHNRKKKTQK